MRSKKGRPASPRKWKHIQAAKVFGWEPPHLSKLLGLPAKAKRSKSSKRA